MMVVIKQKPKRQQQQHLLDVDHQEETTTHFQKFRQEEPPPPVVPQRFERVLNNLTVDLHYPGYAVDVSATREAIAADSKSKMLRLFRKMKEKQRVYVEYYNRNKNEHNVSNDDEIDSLALELLQQRSGSDEKVEKRDISEDWNGNNTKEEDVRDSIEDDGPRDKEDDIYAEDHSHPTNLVHSMQVPQDRRHVVGGDRSHGRLQKLDDLRVDLTYPDWEIDLAHVVDWHRHHRRDTRENTIRFHEIMEGMLEQQYLYLSWKDDDHQDHDQEQEQIQQQNPFPDVDNIAAPIVHYRGSTDCDDDAQEVVEEMKSSLDNNSEHQKSDPSIVNDDGRNKVSEPHRSHSKYALADDSSISNMTVGALCAAHGRRSSSSKLNATNEERKESSETEKKNRYYRSSTSSSSSSSSSSSPRQQAGSDDHTALSPQRTGPPPLSTVTEEELGRHCDICTIRAKTHVLVPCGHLACAACSHHAWRTRSRCPTCQQTVDRVVRTELFVATKTKKKKMKERKKYRWMDG